MADCTQTFTDTAGIHLLTGRTHVETRKRHFYEFCCLYLAVAQGRDLGGVTVGGCCPGVTNSSREEKHSKYLRFLISSFGVSGDIQTGAALSGPDV